MNKNHTLTPPNFHPRFWVFFVMALSILRGFRFPGGWATTQFLVNYDIGMVRRGLWGEVLSSLFGLYAYKYQLIYAVILINYCACIALLVYFSRKLLEKSACYAAPLVVFFSSPAFVAFNDSMGYYDQVGFLFTLLFLRVFDALSRRAYGALYVVMLAVLAVTHEGQVLLWGGVLSLALWLKMGGWQSTPADVARTAGFMLLAVAVLWGINASFVDFTAEQTVELNAMAGQLANFPPRADYFGFLIGGTTRTRENIIDFWTYDSSWDFLLVSALLHLPACCYFVYIIMLQSGRNPLKLCATLAFSLTPLLMYFFGFDLNRWNSYLVIALFLNGIICVQLLQPAEPQAYLVNHKAIMAALFISILSMNSHNYFFDGYGPKYYPYDSNIWYMRNVMNGTAPFPPLP
ncbi:MAG: hypothetical protein EBX37_14505 [Alphaproteobacteria bacterium]|nr:hypothetical protein [Alphaproteobacteria bacterium]